MNRSTWKNPYINFVEQKKKKQNNHIIASRNSQIVPKFLGLTFKVYNGKSYKEITVSEEMINHKFGEFIFTRAKFSFKKKKLKK